MTVVVLAVLLAAVAALPWSQQQTHQQPLPENRSVSSRGGFPDDIWQWSTFDADPMPDGHSLPSRRCTAINPAHKHEILSHGDALAHARRASLDDDRVPHEVETLQHSPLWDDLVRYLLLLIHGGTSTNLDTVCETHATPEQLAQASLVVAVEYDDLSHPQAWIDDAIPVSLMRSTLMAKPGSRTLQRVLHRLVVEMLVLENRRLASLGVSNDAVQSTGRAVRARRLRATANVN